MVQNMSDKELILFPDLKVNGMNLDQAVKQGQEMIQTLKLMGINEATFESGAHFSSSQSTGTTTLAADGIMLEQRQHSTSVTFRNAGSSQTEALEELRGTATQTTLGAFSGHSQQWASQQLSLDKPDE